MRREAIAFLVMASLLLLAATGARANAVKTPPMPACEYVTDIPGAFEKMWTEGGVTHVRHQLWTSVVYNLPGKVPGAIPFATNAGWEDRNIDANGNGDKAGYFNDGVFVGRYSGTYVSWTAYVTFAGHGPNNQLFTGTILEPSDACEGGGNLATAVLLMPHG